MVYTGKNGFEAALDGVEEAEERVCMLSVGEIRDKLGDLDKRVDALGRHL
jgi:hypothetical protein